MESTVFSSVQRGHPLLYGAVNKRFLSTGETGELVLENVGFGLNPGVKLPPPPRLLSNRRDRPACKNLPNVADTGNGGGWRCRQDSARGIKSKWRMDSDKRGAVDSHSGALETVSSSGLVRAYEEQAVVVDNGDAKAVKPTGAAKEVPVECGVLGKEDDR